MSSQRLPVPPPLSTSHHKKKTADRYRSEFGLDSNDFGLNGQDFGLSQLKQHKKKQQQQQQDKHRRSLNSTTHTGNNQKHFEYPPQTPLRTPRSKPDQLTATKDTLEAFADDVATLWCGFGGIPVLDEPPSTLTFLRDYVSRSRPCIIRNALMVRDDNPHKNTKKIDKQGSNSISSSTSHLTLVSPTSAVHSHANNNGFTRNSDTRPLHLSLDDLVDIDPELEVVVDATPDGHGDCIRTVLDYQTQQVHRLFITPEQRRMSLREFRKQLRQGRKQLTEDDDNESQESDSDEEPEEEIYDELDGKRIYPLKGTQKSPRRKCSTGFDDILDGCGTAPGVADATQRASGMIASCNAMDDMQDMISSMPFFNDLIDGSNSGGNNSNPNSCSQQGFEVNDNSMVATPPPPPPSVLYYSRQNDCFRTELPSIYKATRHVIPDSLPFAEEAFGTGKPEAMNLWMGDERAVSSMHKDPYENMFYVASGEKIFTLCPPADAPYLYEQDFLSGSFDSQPSKQPSVFPTTAGYEARRRKWTVQTDFHKDNTKEEEEEDDDIRLNHNLHSPQLIHHNFTGNDLEPMCPEAAIDHTNKDNDANKTTPYVRWIEADVNALADPRCEREQRRKFPLLQYAHPIRQVRVQAGELLYLPALWFHRVTQSRETIGINWWYNMQFCSPQWCYFQLLSKLQPRPSAQLPATTPLLDHDDDDDDNNHNQQRTNKDRTALFVESVEEPSSLQFANNFPSSTKAAEAFKNTSQAAEATIRGVLGTIRNNWE
ncbi:Jumonji domain containing 7 [Seminavis robusta]|uniref:Jumonji domain containing 7 n=1 Tax=Seminavis robusta TaxID=568900 RepID=A0A9N8DEK6_9STRA|nr:Jumonji domain containing 7 [Seminavis robusta]|eukprot:Sro57_g033300.1 Jumonji domain containing 7 (768) ;mRNA; f:67464-69767